MVPASHSPNDCHSQFAVKFENYRPLACQLQMVSFLNWKKLWNDHVASRSMLHIIVHYILYYMNVPCWLYKKIKQNCISFLTEYLFNFALIFGRLFKPMKLLANIAARPYMSVIVLIMLFWNGEELPSNLWAALNCPIDSDHTWKTLFPNLKLSFFFRNESCFTFQATWYWQLFFTSIGFKIAAHLARYFLN